MTAPAPERTETSTADVRLCDVLRGGLVESVHHGALAVVTADGPVWTVGDVATPVWTRSAIKPFQALPLLELGVAERLGLDARHLALVSASHDGTPQHVAVVRELLARGGLDADALRCGPHAPFDKASSLAIARSGGKPERVHNNCSGKHAGFLLLAQALGAPLATYLDPAAPGQRLVRDAVAAMADVPAEAIDVAIDGCGAPTMRLPLVGLARAFCRLVNPEPLAPVRAAACRSLFEAVTQQPVLLSGDARFCAALIRAAPGCVYPKNGAEGVYAVGVRGPRGGFGVAVKVRDGAERGYWPVVVDLLTRAGAFGDPVAGVPAGLADFAQVPVRNTQGLDVGVVRTAAGLEFPW